MGFGVDGRRGSNRVKRGGNWNNNAQNCRSANRNNNTPTNRNNNNGFRLASSPRRPTAADHGPRPCAPVVTRAADPRPRVGTNSAGPRASRTGGPGAVRRVRGPFQQMEAAMRAKLRTALTVLALALLAAPALAGSGTSGNFTIDLRAATYVEISAISSPQTAWAAFPVTFTVKELGGGTVGWNGTLTLGAPPSAAPGTVQVVNGVGTKQVVLDTPGVGVQLTAAGGGLAGASNAFDVLPGALNCPGAWIDATVRNGEGAPIAGAVVHLDTGQSCTTGQAGSCRIEPLPAGTYDAWAMVGAIESPHQPATATCNPGNVLTLVAGQCSNPLGLSPVLFVPGIMGSTVGCGISPIPGLTRNRPRPQDWCSFDNGLATYHGLLDPVYAEAGWRDLAAALRAVEPEYRLGCTMFTIPYDWRLTAADAVEEYLAPAIADAKQIAGVPRVSIVAHSMGGVVARDYVNSDLPQPSDIDKLIMVGTPNHGAAIAYLLWEGGDPVLADAVAQESSASGPLFGMVDFYRLTTHKLYETHYGSILGGLLPDHRITYYPGRPLYRRVIRNFLHSSVWSVRQLLPTSDVSFLESPSGTPRGIQLLENSNYVLDDLNGDLSRLTTINDPDPNRVRSVVLAADDVSTLSRLRVFDEGPNGAAEFFADGRPRVDAAPLSVLPNTWLRIDPNDLETDAGDGTVLRASAELPAPDFIHLPKGGHSGLVKSYIESIVFFLTGEVPPRELERPEVVPPYLAVGVSGRAQPLLTDPSSQRLGVDPVTRVLREEIPGGTALLGADDAEVGASSPADGTYAVALAGAYPGEFKVSVHYTDEEVEILSPWLGYYDGTTPFTFSFAVDAASPERVTVDLAPPPPAGLQADYAAGLTHLSWEASGDPGVTAYAVYAQLETDGRLAPLGTSTVASFATGHDWAADEGDPVRLYAVAARYAGGHEGFLSNVARNDDRDHDGLRDSEETRRGTGIDDPDSDDDGLSDGAEDGLGTDPLDADTDGDGFTDGDEVAHGADPLNPDSMPWTYFGSGFETGDLSEWGEEYSSSLPEMTVLLPGGVPLTLVQVPAGTFLMGSPEDERGRYPTEVLHEVTLTQPYWIGKTEVTQGQWEAVMGPWSYACGGEPYGVGPDFPAYCVSWNDIAGPGGFLDLLNTYLGTTLFRLPTEAEWERAARGGTQTRFSHGNVLECDDGCGDCALHNQHMKWCGQPGPTVPVASKGANPFGLHDVHGNVEEAVQDWYGTYAAGPATDPTGPASGSARVVRGGYWTGPAAYCRSAARMSFSPTYGSPSFGFRLAWSQ